MFDEQDRKYFYDEFKKNGYEVGSYDDFKHDLGNKEDREWYYNEAKKMGYDVGSSSDFDKMVMEPASQLKAQHEAVQQPSQPSNVPNSVPEQQAQQPQPKVQPQNASGSQVTMEQPRPGEVVDGITGETILVQPQQEPKKMVDNTSKSVQQIYDSYVNGNKGYAFSNTVADLLAKGVTDDPDEARDMVKNAVYNAADRSTLAITNNMAKQLGDSTQNEEEMVKGMYYSHDVQDKLQAEANKHGFEYNDYVNSFVKPALVESLVSKYGEKHRKLAQGIAARLFSHEGDVTNVLMNQDINDAMVGVVNKYVGPSVVDEFNKAEEASNAQMAKYNDRYKGYWDVDAASPFSFGAISDANKIRDPQKILDDLQKKFSKLYQNPQFLNDLSTSASNVLQKYGMIGNMKGDPKQYKSMIEGVIKNELDQLEIKKLIPKGSVEYIMKTGLGNSIAGKVYRKIAHSDYQNQLEDIANAQYQPGFWERLGSGTLTFAADAWSYWLPGAAGGRLTRSMIAKAEGKLATDLMAHGMERGVAERAARVLIGRSKAVALKTGAAHGAVTFGGQSVISTPIDEVYRTGQFDENGERYNPSVGRIALNTLKEGGKGALVGTLMQGSTIANMIGKGKGLATNILADVGGTALDASIMGGQQILERMNEDPDFKPTGKDIAATIAESAVNLKTIGLPGLVGKYRGFKTAREFNRKYNFTDADIAELKAHGYDDLRSAFENSAVHGYKPVKNEQTGRVELQEDTSARVEEHHLIQQYMNLMNDKNVPEVLKAKMMAVVEGKRPSALSNVVDTEVYRGDDGKYYLETLNNDGGVIDRKAYSSHEAARKDEKKLEYTKTLGVTSELEQAYHTDALQERLDDLYNQAAQKYNMGEKLTDEDTAAIYLHQNAGAIKDIIAKQQRGEMLTDEEQQKVDIYRKYYDSAFANSPIMTEYVRTFEDSQGVAHGTLRKALESKDEKYKDLVKSYQEQLYNDIVLKRDTKQTADDIYNEYRGNGQPRLEQNGVEGTGENEVPNGEGAPSTTGTEGVPPVGGGTPVQEEIQTQDSAEQSYVNDGKGGVDNMGNTINSDGSIYTESVKTIDDITDDDFDNPTRSVELPSVPQNVSSAIGANGKPVVIKKNIFVKNAHNHPELDAADSRAILTNALYNPNLVGQTQPIKRPSYKVAVQTGDKNSIVVLDVYNDKKQVEIVGWRLINEKGLAKMKRQAEREGGQFLILSPSDGSAAALSTLPHDLSSGSKDTNNSSNGNGSEATLTFENAFAEGQNAYKNGDAESLVRINHEDDVAPIRVERAFKDNEKGLFAVYDAMNDGEDMEAFIAKHQDELTPQQVDAIRKWVAAKEATKGVQDALQHADDGYGESLKEQIWPYATEDGNIVPVTLTNGRTAFLKKANEYGGAFVVIPSETGEPEVKMIPNAEIKNSGTPVPIDDYVAQRVAEKQEASKNALMETIGEQQPQPNEKVMVAMEADEEPAEMIFEGYNTKGDVVLSDGKEYVSVSQVKFDHWRANAKRSIINAELDAEDAQQEQTALAKQEAERKKRYADNIVGYGDGKIDYSSKDSNPKVVAEYLQEEYGENHDKLMKLVNGSRGDIKEQLDNKRKKAAEYQSWLDMNSDIDPETANKVKDELAQVNEEIADLEGRYDKWNAIRKEVMTDEDVRTMKEERTQNIKKVGVDESALPTDDEPEVPIISKDELKKQYATKDEARAYITDERKRIKNMQYDIWSQINGIDDMLEKYKQGDIDLSDEELRDLNTTKAQLEARQNDLTNSAKGLKELDGKLNILYIRETAEANKKAVDDVSTPEGRKAILDRAWRKYKRGKGKSKNPAQLWGDTVGKTLKRLYGRLPVDIFDTTPHTAEEYVVNGITPFGLNYEGNKYSKGVKQETGLSRKDFAGTHLLAAKGKGRTVDQIVHDLWENRRDENLDNLTEDEIRNAFISLITSGIDAYDIRYAHIDRKVAEAEKYLEEQQEAAENAEAEYMAEQKRRAENPDEEVPTILDNDLPFTPGADDDNLPFDRGGKKGNASTANMTEPQKVAYNAVRTMLKNAGIPVKVKTNEEMEEVARKEDERRLTQLLANPRVHFQIKTPEQREAAKNAYDWATEHRPDKWKQYAVVDMDHPNQLPTYYEKQELAKKDSVYYTNLLWGNYKVFDLNKPFDEQTSKLTGKFPEKFDPSKGEELRIKVQELEKQRQEAENAYKAKQEERSEYNAKLMKDYMNEHGLATENDIPDDVWNKLREKSFEKYQDELDGLFNRYVDLDKQLKYMNRSGVKFLEGDGIVYGYTDGKEIVLNQDHLNPDTPLHEYQHIWRMAAKEKNPDLIAHGDELIKQTSLFEELKNDPNYKHLNDEQLCDEAFSRLTGEDGEKILEKMAEDAIKENPLDTAKELNVINRLKKWLKDFWYWTLDTFTKWKPEDIKKMTLEDIRNLVLRDLAKGVDPREVLKKPQTQNYKRNYELSEKEKNETTERIDKRIAELNRLEKEQSLKSEHGNLAESHEHGYLPSNINIDGVQSVAPLNAKIDKKFLPKNFYLENLAKFITSMGNDADITTDNFTKKLFEGLGMTPHGRNMQVSEYFKYQTDDGGKVTVRLSDHSGNALSIIKKGGRADKGYSIVINLDTSPKTKFKPNKFANVVEYIYNNPDSEGLKNIARSIFNLIDTDEYLDLLGATDINVSPRGKTIVDAKTDKEVMKFSNRLKSAIDETETSPSDAQKESGNYKKGHLKFGGYDYTIENPKGSTRSGVDENGKPWSQTMHDTYGYIRGKFGKDGDHLDMFINDGADLDTWNGNVYVVDQVDPKTGEFDEHKVMYGFDSEEEAKKAYLSNYEEGWKGLGSITGVSKDVFDKWVDSSKRKLKPFAEHSISKDARDDEYLEAVKYGDMEKAQKMVNEAAEAAGYSTDSSYQGTSAFNGAAPWGNGYFLTKEERKEAWDNGEFEGESTLGDYINDDIDGGNLEDLTNTASYRSADPMRKEAIDNVRNAIQKKRKTITMYRSVPSDVREGSFRNGDWVTPSRAYAVDNAKLHGWGNDYNIIKQEVPVDDVWFDGNDIAEWGYGREEDYINDTDFAYKNTKNNRKLLDAVTYDDKGNVIPLSQRFNEKSPDIRFSRRTEKKDEEKTMLGMHNITLSKLIKAIKQGGFAAPSMGVIDSKNGIYSDYGEITLIPKAEKLAKSKGKNAGTFLGDGWTPIYPSVEKVMNKQGEKVFNKDMDKLYDDVDVTLWSNIKDSWKRYFSDGDVSDGLYFQYLQEKGMNPETVYQKGRYDAEISKEVMRISDNGRKSNFTDDEVAKLIELKNKATGEDNDVDSMRKKLEKQLENAKIRENDLLFALKKKRLSDLEGIGNSDIAADFAKDVAKDARYANKPSIFDTMRSAMLKVSNDKLYSDFTNWLENKSDEYGAEEMLYTGTTPTGKPKYIPNTVENAVKLMKKKELAGGYGMFGSIGSFIAKHSDMATTLKQMKAAKNKLISKADAEKRDEKRDEIYREYRSLANQLDVPGGYSFDSGDARMLELADHKGHEKEYIKKVYNMDVSDEWVDRYNKLVNTIKNDYPVFYFETKFMRPYGLDEFEKAIVPKDTPKDVVDALKKAGIDVRTYENKEDREKVTMDAVHGSDDILFHRGDTSVKEPTHEEVVLRDAVIDKLRSNGMDVITDTDEGQSMLDAANQEDKRVSAHAMLSNLKDVANFIRKHVTKARGGQMEIFVPKTVNRKAENVLRHKIKKHIIDVGGLNHSYNNHGQNGKKLEEGDIPLTKEDMELAPYILIAPDEVLPGSESYGRQSVRYVKHLSNGKIIYIEAEGNLEGDELVSKNMWANTDPHIRPAQKVVDAHSKSAPKLTSENVILKEDAAKIRKDAETAIENDRKLAENAANSANKAKFFVTPDGREAYGYTIGGKMYIDTRIANSDTPIHEYSHLWSEAVRNSNPEEWENIVNLMKGVKPIWDKVKEEYPDLKTDSEIADEVLAHYSGKRGAERLRQEYEAIADGDGSITDKAKAMTALQRVKNVLDRFWKAVADFLHIHYTSAEEVADRVMKDLLDGIDPREYGANGEGISYSKVTDPKTIEKLDKEETVKVYRAMQLGEDGKLYPPMAAKVKGQFVEPIELGKWEQADERPELADDNGMFTLNKGNGKSLKAAYNPYLHTSRTPLNDQFSEAQSRPNLVTVEVEVPKSELTSGYKADKAKDAVGEVEWKAGIVQGQLTGKRKVVLSRWDKPIRIVPDSEVADVIKDMLDGQDITMPSNVVTPSLRKELEKRGVPFVETDNRGRIVGGENDGVHYSKIYGKNAKSDKSVENNAEFESKANDFTKVYRMYDMDEYGLPDYAETAVEKAKETIEKELRDGCNNDPAIFFGKMSEDEYDKLLKITHAEDFGLDVPFADIHLEEYTDEREELYDDAMYNLPGEMLKDVKNIKKYIPREVIDAMIPKNPKIIKMSRLPEEFNRQLQAITGMSHDEVLNTYGVDNSPQMLTDEDYEAVQNSKKANVKMALGDKIGRTAESVEKEQNITDSVVNTANQLGGAEANVYTSEEQVPDKYKDAVKKGGKGWYDPETHSVHVYLPNCEDANDAQRTVFHEKVGHEGMEVLLGGESGVRKFANFVYNSVGKSIREKILDFAKKYDSKWENPDRLNVGTQEYIAHLAEEGPQTAEDFSLWTKMKHYLIKALKKLNIRIPGLLNDKDLRYYLMKAGKALHVWDNMPKEQQEAMMSQATGKEIKNALSENKGKPKRKKGESMAQYMNRVLEWEKWRDARADKSDPEPPQFYDIDKDPEGKKEWEQLNKDWRARHQLTGDDMPARPERKPGESDDDYMARIKDYEKWQQAMKDDRDPMPDMFAWEKQKQDEASQKYEDWLTRHELNEQQNADLDLYEGRTHVAETNPKADDADKQLMQDLADVTSTDVSKDGAARSVKYAVIRRRKNMEEAMADDAIVINDIKRNIEQMAESGVVDKVLSSYTGNESKAEKLAESIPYIIEAPRRVRDLTNQLNASGAFEKNHISIQPQDVINLQPLVEDFAAAIKMHEETVVNEKGEPEKVLKYDDPHAASEMASKIANVINSYHELDADFVPVDGTDILSDNVRQIVAYSQIAPKGVEWQNLSPEMRKTLNAIRDWYNYTYTWLKDNHTLRDDAGYNIDYVNHVWDKDASDEDAYRTYVENRQRTKSPNEKPRTISTLMEGISLGLVPKTTDITKLMGTYSKNNIEAYANKSFLQEVSGLNVVERDEKGEVVSSDPVLSSTPPFNLEQYKYFEVPGVGPVWVYNVSPKQVEVTNPLTGNRHVPYSQHSAASRFGAVMETYESNPFWKKFDEVSGLAKKLELGFSGFHAGALTEVYMVQNMPEFGPKKAMAYFWKYIMGDTMKNGQLPCYANPEDFQDAAAHLVKFGATSDYSATDVQNLFDSLRGGLESIRKRMDGNMAQKAVGTVTLPMEVVSQFLSMANKGMDVALWDFLHDGLKMATYKLRSERTRARAAKEGWTQTQLDMALDEDGQFVNDMFGGQHWDVLGVSRKTIRKCGRWLLSPDWNASTTRHFLAMTGYGSIWNEATAENFKEYYKNLWAKVRGKGKLSPDDWQRLSRQKSALICYGIGFSIFYEAIANAVNAAFRAMDEEKEKEKADEIRKTNPDYKSAYELAYPEGMKWYDYLMGGNSLGQQSKIFVGRYADGTEMYIRHGKQFREVPEYLFNSKGEFEFPGPFVHRLLGKANPMLRMALDDINYLSDFQTSHADQELQRKYGKTLGLLYKDALYFAPFLIPSQENKEFKAVDFFFPSAKGFSNWKAQDYFKTFLLSGDMKGMMLTYNSCVKNGLDAEKQLQAAISSVKALEADEMRDGVTSLQIATDRFNKAKGLTEKRKMREKIRKFLSQSEYKVFTAQQAMDMVKAYLEGEDFKDLVKADDKYLMVATSADVTEDWRIQSVRASTKQYADKLSEMKENHPEAAKEFVQANKRIFDARRDIERANRNMNKLKKQLGKGNDKKVLDQIRKARKELLKKLNGMEKR